MTSYHNHTLFSDGKASVADMAEAAAQAGLDEVGISDHLVVHPEGQTFRWAMPLERFDEYAAEVQNVARTAKLPVRLGIEADYFPETIDRLRSMLDRHPFDFIIGSVHFAGGFIVDESRKRWAQLTEEERETKWELYWSRVAGLARSRAFDVVAHLDIPKRFGFKPKAPASQAALAALDAIAEAGMAIEINTAGWRHPVKEAYPSPVLLAAARERGIPVQINADAHEPCDLAKDFGPGLLMAREAGYTQTARFSGRRRTKTAF